MRNRSCQYPIDVRSIVREYSEQHRLAPISCSDDPVYKRTNHNEKYFSLRNRSIDTGIIFVF